MILRGFPRVPSLLTGNPLLTFPGDKATSPSRFPLSSGGPPSPQGPLGQGVAQGGGCHPPVESGWLHGSCENQPLPGPSPRA